MSSPPSSGGPPNPWSTPSRPEHRPILATSSSFLSHLSSSPPASPTLPSSPSTSGQRRRVPSGTSSTSSALARRPLSPVHDSAPSLNEMDRRPSSAEKGKAREDGGLSLGKEDPGARRALPTSVGLGPVLEDVLKTANGRDKIFKLLQYSIKLYLWMRTCSTQPKPTDLDLRLKQTASSLSLSRRVLILFNSLNPIMRITSPASFASLLPNFIDLVGGLSDDVYTLHRLGLVGKRFGARADRWANRLWLLSTVIALSHLSVSTPSLSRRIQSMEHSVDEKSSWASNLELSKLRAERDEERATAMKLFADLIFVSYEVCGWAFLKEPTQALAGFIAASIGSGKLIRKHGTKLMGA